MKLNSNLREVDERFIIDEDKRIRAFRERQWNRNEGFEPLEMAAIVFGGALVISVCLLLLGCIVWAKYGS